MLQWLKAQFSRERFMTSSVKVLEGAGPFHAKPQPFSYEAAVRQFRGWVYAAAMINANAAASVPLRLYMRRKPGTPLFQSHRLTRAQYRHLRSDTPSLYVQRKANEFRDDMEEVTELHPIIELLTYVNPYFNGFDLAVLRFLYLQLTGNAYVHPIIDQALGVPVELWTMPAQWVQVIPGDQGEEEFIKGYLYGQPGNPQCLDFAPDEVGHFKYPNPHNLFYGMGRVEAAWGAIDLNDAEHEMDRAMFRNHARPDYAAIVKAGATDPQLTRFEQKLDRELRGVRKSGRFVTITGDVSLVPLSFPPKDLGGRDEIVKEIASVFGVPEPLLKGGDAILSNYETGQRSWRENTVLPMVRHDEEKLNEWLVPLFGLEGDAFLAYDNPVPENREFELQESATLVAAGIRTINEDRALRGDESIDGGDVARVNGVALESLDDAAQMAPGGFALPPMGATRPALTLPTPKPTLTLSHAASMAGFTGHHHKAGDADDTQRDDESESFITRLAAVLADIFEQQRDAVLAALGGGKAVRTKDRLSDALTTLAGFDDELAAVLRESLEESLTVGATAGLDAIQLPAGTFDVSNPAVQAFLDEYTPRLARSLNEQAARQIQNVLTEGIVDGESIGQLTRRVEESDAFSTDGIANRAEMIARSESARGYVRGQEEGWRQSDVVAGKQWLLAPNSCEFCKMIAKMFKRRTVELGDAFLPKGSTLRGTEGGRMKLDYTDIEGPPLHPNCRCDLVAVMT